VNRPSEHGIELTVLMPVYNERNTVALAIDRLSKAKVKVPIELVVVDDGSTDGTTEVLDEIARANEWIKIVRHSSNRGKGTAIRTGLAHAEGKYVCTYDADLEYDPSELSDLLVPLANGDAEVVYGVRSFAGHTAHSFRYVVGNRLVTTFANVLFDTYLRDLMSCYKMMPLDLMRSLGLRARGFEVEAEVTAKLLRRGHRIFEVLISYRARSHEEGKKLKSSTGWKVLATLIAIRIRRRE
jgi:glycosyltransferase involved in cell wall biosynthesis